MYVIVNITIIHKCYISSYKLVNIPTIPIIVKTIINNTPIIIPQILLFTTSFGSSSLTLIDGVLSEKERCSLICIDAAINIIFYIILSSLLTHLSLMEIQLFLILSVFLETHQISPLFDSKPQSNFQTVDPPFNMDSRNLYHIVQHNPQLLMQVPK